MKQDKKSPIKLPFILRMATFMNNFRTSFGIQAHPFLYPEVRVSFTPLNHPLNKPAGNEVVLTQNNRIEYILSNQWGIWLNTVTALKNRHYQSNSLSINYHKDLSKRNLTHLSLGLDLGLRKLRNTHGTFVFEDSFRFGRKNFDSGRVALYNETREWNINPSLSINFRLHPLIHLGTRANFFLPVQSSSGIYAREEKEFWFWNRAKAFQKDESNPIRNKYSLGIYIIFNF